VIGNRQPSDAVQTAEKKKKRRHADPQLGRGEQKKNTPVLHERKRGKSKLDGKKNQDL